MEQTNLETFNFEGQQTRIVIRDGAPWWVGKDVCDILGYANTSKAIEDHCKHKETFGITNRYTGKGSVQQMVIIPESDVYRLIIRSNMPEAERFETWVMEEVLPSIRKHGAYMTPQKLDDMSNNPEAITMLLEALKDERNKTKQLEQQIKDNALNISSGRMFQESLRSKKTVVTGQFNRIQREGNLILIWLDSNEMPVEGLTGMNTDIHFDEEKRTYYFDYDYFHN